MGWRFRLMVDHAIKARQNKLNKTNMETVRGKFTCTKATKTQYGTEVSFWALYSNNPEDNQYAAATPSGHMTMMVNNPPAEEFFKEGTVFYLDFRKAE